MELKVDIPRALSAFQTIVDQGNQVDTRYQFDGLQAESDYDGYTLHISDNKVTLHIYFHNRFELDSENPRDSEDFLRKVYRVAAHS